METIKKQKRVGMEESKYRKLMRRENQIMKAKAFLREAWRILGKMEKVD